MTCRDALHLVEAIAAGDLEVDDAVRAHFESCPACASALAAARRIELALQARAALAAPPRFTSSVLARIRNDRWRSEQRVDRIFNVAIVAASLLVIAGLAALTNVGALLSVGGWIWGGMAQLSGQLVQQAAPTLMSYVAAGFLLMSTLAMWWWAERRLSL
jgi:anti-sigma factor RsiW